MNSSPTKRFPCAVCGKESDEHARWFLLVENHWLDRLKVLSWHPALAEQEEMHSVCGKQHLQMLITHWLNHASLQFPSDGMFEFTLADNRDEAEGEPEIRSGGRLVGELAVHRESLSRLWTGSPETRQSIFAALIGGLEASHASPAKVVAADEESAETQMVPVPDFSLGSLNQYAFQ